MPMRASGSTRLPTRIAVLGDLVRRVPLALVKRAHAPRGVLDRRAHLGRGARRQLRPTRRRAARARRAARLSNSRGQRAQGGVAPGAHLGDRLSRRRLDVGGQLAAAVAERRPACAGSRGCFFRIPGSWRLSFEVRQNSSLRGPRSTEIYSANGSTHLRGAGVRAGGASNGSSASRSLARTGPDGVGRRGRGADARRHGARGRRRFRHRHCGLLRGTRFRDRRRNHRGRRRPARRPALARRSPPARRPGSGGSGGCPSG